MTVYEEIITQGFCPTVSKPQTHTHKHTHTQPRGAVASDSTIPASAAQSIATWLRVAEDKQKREIEDCSGDSIDVCACVCVCV